MKGQNVGYIRVSSLDQNTTRQLDGIELDTVFEDHCSGKDINRPQLIACLRHLRKGDRLHVHSIDRLARSLKDLQELVESLTEQGVSVQFHKENLIFSGDSNPMHKLMFQMMGAFAEFERSMIRERQREGIAAARKQGKQIGAKPKLSSEQVDELKRRVAIGDQKKSLAQEYGISRQTLYNLLTSA
ncbi:recombinase family protein [Endozoicomonas sp. SCSIO W0465]|uniref:recombinase family protein n=1 Tax=Endozoicomonas sp. SCSIO W0465 TaxID=2918516 RepID=UPI00207580BB|nr:recombinase family protein [Endozoicomonas sp. SCSIO W0465]USE33930.1 recombinase family protein [Endozoicomonas sp. SCSIO W0465]